MGVFDVKNEVKELNRHFVKMKDPVKVENIIQKIVTDGIENLQVIADFDHTITKQHVNGTKQLSSFCLINHCKGLPSHFRETDRQICEKYIPIQTDPNLSKAEKIPLMIEFYEHSSKLYSGWKFSLNDIKEVAQEYPAELRDGTSQLVSQLEEHNIPLLVFSAGLGDMVTALLEHHKVLRPNVHVLSNFLRFTDGHVDGFKNDFIHPLNKNSHTAANSPYFKDMSNRSNVIVLGDNTGDDEMADGLPHTEALLKIGFIYDREDLLPSFLDHFDVVLMDDQTFDLPNAIVRACIKNSKNKIRS